MAVMGDFLSDAADAVGGAISDPGKAASDVVNTAVDIATHPEDDFNALVNKGPAAVASAVGAAWSGVASVADWAGKGLADFAKSAIGREVLDIAAGAAYMGLAFSPLGPVSLLVFAVPGLMRGDDLSSAWLHGMFDQGVRIAKFFGANGAADILPPEVTDQLQNLQTTLTTQTGDAASFLQSHLDANALHAAGLPDLANLDYTTLAAKLGIREDAAALALANLRNNAQEVADVTAKIASGFFAPDTGRASLSVGARQAIAGRYKATLRDPALVAQLNSRFVTPAQRIPHEVAIATVANNLVKATPLRQAPAPVAVRAPAPTPEAPSPLSGSAVMIGAVAIGAAAGGFFLWRRARRRR